MKKINPHPVVLDKIITTTRLLDYILNISIAVSSKKGIYLVSDFLYRESEEAKKRRNK